MVRFFLFILLFLLLYTILQYFVKGVLVWRKRQTAESGPEELVQDPSCQTYIPKRTALKKRIKGKTYYFCTKECLKKFLEEK